MEVSHTADRNPEETFLMTCMRRDVTDSSAHSLAATPGTMLLNVRLADDTKLAVFLTKLTTYVAYGVLTATGTAIIPGRGRDTFTAVAQAVDIPENKVVFTIELGPPQGEPICFAVDVAHLLDNGGGDAGSAANYLSSLLGQVLSSRGS